jgi:hypothetical protein
VIGPHRPGTSLLYVYFRFYRAKKLLRNLVKRAGLCKVLKIRANALEQLLWQVTHGLGGQAKEKGASL